MTSEEKKKNFNRTLFVWHKKNYRDMPWRQTHDSYKILISEVMLQQTQVNRVRTKYNEFLEQFPNVKVLAKAPLGSVLRVWSGLGYNRRAKFLYECAKTIMAKHGGKFPNTYEELVLLPCIGRSTAGALLAFSFRQDTPMIDTNIRRILARVFFKKKLPSDKALYDFAVTLIPRGKGRIWNYAMLDLGATLCTARDHSSDCPFMKLHGKVGDFIYKKPQKKFAGSRRFYRGQILKLLASKHELEYASIQKSLKLSKHDVVSIITDLLKEGLVKRSKGKVTLP